ncbi:MAG: heavy metal efflux pump, CzcA family, partial [Phycisphaerales bacterium]|nr:heavy metal efflux pump, CzcA family [Phycisphaerales bacterium]
PLLWATGTGADVMRRLAAPMLGGLFTSFLMELLIYPVIFYIAKGIALPGSSEPIAPLRNLPDPALSDRNGNGGGSHD